MSANAFKIEETKLCFTVQKSMLHDMATAIVKACNNGGMHDRAIMSFGFLCGEFANHPERTNEDLQYDRRPHSAHFSVNNISNDEITFDVSISAAGKISSLFKLSSNKAVAALGYQLLRLYNSYCNGNYQDQTNRQGFAYQSDHNHNFGDNIDEEKQETN